VDEKELDDWIVDVDDLKTGGWVDVEVVKITEGLVLDTGVDDEKVGGEDVGVGVRVVGATVGVDEDEDEVCGVAIGALVDDGVAKLLDDGG
jgi:hypothetical protein